MIAIDADSHFTVPIAEYERPPQLPPEVRGLINSGRLCFGHWEIGAQHNSYVVLLRALRDLETESIFRKVMTVSSRCFGKDGPDIIVFPADSTAIHLTSKLSAKFGNNVKTVVASPAFRAYGKHSLRLELATKHFVSPSGKSVLNVMFFDDSLSSGDTETHAIEAFARERDNHPKHFKVNWLSFVVLLRGQRTHKNYSRAIPDIAKRNKFSYTFAAFGAIRPESVTRSECPLCEASQRVRRAASWARGSRPNVRRTIGRLDELLRPRPIEWLVAPLSCLDNTITMEVLALAGMSMPDACIHIFQCCFEREEMLVIERRLSFLVFLALYFNDAGSYISWEQIVRLIEESASKLTLDAQSQCDAFLISLAIFPASVLRAAAGRLICTFAAMGGIDVAATVMALTFSNQQHTFLDGVPREVFERREGILRIRQRSLFEEINNLRTSEAGLIGFANEVLLADLNTVSSSPREDNPAWVSRTLCDLLNRGKHPSFLSAQIENLSLSSVDAVFDGLMQALKLMHYLPPSAVDHLEPRLAAFETTLRKCDRANVDKCKTLAKEIVEDLWEQEIHDKFFVYPKRMHTLLRENVIAAIAEYSDEGVKVAHIAILSCDEVTLDCEAFAPGRMTLVSHIQNLLNNPFRHYPAAQFRRAIHDSPLAVAYLRLDEEQERLLLVVADRAKHPVTGNLWTVKRGLSNVRASMQVFGGDISFLQSAVGLRNVECGPTLSQGEECRRRNLEPSLYQNIFVTAFPIARQTL